MNTLLQRIENVKPEIGFSVQGSINCSALYNARNIARLKTIRKVVPTNDSRSDWEDSVDVSLKEFNKDQQGFDNGYSPVEELNKYAYMLQVLDIRDPSLNHSLHYLKNSDFRVPQDNILAQIIGEVRDEFVSEALAKEFVLAQLREEHKHNLSDWELLGEEAIIIVDSAVSTAQPCDIPDGFDLKVDRFARRTVKRLRERQGLTRSLGACKELKQLYI